MATLSVSESTTRSAVDEELTPIEYFLKHGELPLTGKAGAELLRQVHDASVTGYKKRRSVSSAKTVPAPASPVSVEMLMVSEAPVKLTVEALLSEPLGLNSFTAHCVRYLMRLSFFVYRLRRPACLRCTAILPRS